MPIYEYHCDACDTVFEEWHRHADDVMEQPCPKCAEAAHRLISNTSFVLKGGGWYVTEYGNRKSDTPSTATGGASESPTPEKDSVSPAAKTETAPAPAAKSEAAPAPAPAS